MWLGLCVSGNAAPILDPAGLTAGATIVTFEEFAVGTSGPLSAGIATISSSRNWGVGAEQFTQYPGIFEGQWYGAGDFLPASSFTIEFSIGVQEFGMGILDPGIAGTQLEAFDGAGESLETLAPILGPSGGVFSSFAGFSRVLADIRKVVLTPADGDFVGIDTVSFNVGVAVMPLPAALPLFAGGLALLGLLGWRSKRKAVAA
jgi:hypothetical protein